MTKDHHYGAPSVDLTKDHHYDAISKIDKSFRQQTLLMGLKSSEWSQLEKARRIEMAASLENLLPSRMEQSVVQSVNVHSGGLMNDWQFDLQ